MLLPFIIGNELICSNCDNLLRFQKTLASNNLIKHLPWSWSERSASVSEVWSTSKLSTLIFSLFSLRSTWNSSPLGLDANYWRIARATRPSFFMLHQYQRDTTVVQSPGCDRHRPRLLCLFVTVQRSLPLSSMSHAQHHRLRDHDQLSSTIIHQGSSIIFFTESTSILL